VKTISLKKVSAVAVASLGFGLLSVVPAQAAGSAASWTDADDTITVAAVGTSASSTFSITAGAGDNTKAELATTLTLEVPSDSSVTLTQNAATGTTDVFSATGFALGTATDAATPAVDVSDGGLSLGTAVTGAGTMTFGTATIVPDVVGVYKLKLSHAGTVADTLVIYVGTSLDAVNTNKAFSAQGSDITSTGWKGVAGGQATVRFTNFTTDVARTYYVTTTGGAITAATERDAGSNLGSVQKTNTTDFGGGINFTTDGSSLSSDAYDITVTDNGAATSVLAIKYFNASTGAATTFATATVTWGVAPALSATYSTAKLAAGNDCTTAATTAVVLANTAGVTLAAGATTGASLCIQTKDQYDVALTGQALSVTISGPGLIRLDDNTTTGVTGNVRTQSLTAASRASTSTAAIGITADGTAGVATITVTSGTTVIATKTVTFYGSVAKYTPTVLQVVSADGVATTDAVLVAATDAAGVVVPGATIYAFSGNTSAASVPSSVTTVTSAGTLGGTAPASYQAATPIGSAEVNVTGVSGTTEKEVTLTFGNASTLALSTVKATAVVKIGSIKASSIKVTTDKTSYAPGEAMKITFSMTDSLGRPIAAGAGTGLLDSVITSASLSGDTLPTTAIASLTGSKTYTVFAPLSGGKLKITTTTGAAGTFVATAAADQVIVTDVTVTDPNASLLTQIDALNAKIVALNALIAKIMKKLGVK